MIRSFKDKETERIYHRFPSLKLPESIQQTALRKLRVLHNAATITDLRVPPANHLEKLKGDLSGLWSIRINDRWRICFVWHDNDAYDVEIVDYH